MKKLFVLFVAAFMLLSLAACGEGATPADDTKPAQTTATVETTLPAETQAQAAFKVTVTDSEGNPVQGVILQVCSDMCFPGATDENGVASFNMEITDEHKLSVLTCPEGYVYSGEAEIKLEDGATEYALVLDAQ